MIELIKGELVSLVGVEQSDEELPRGAIIVGSNGTFKTNSSPIFDVVQPTKDTFQRFGFKEITPTAELTKKVPWDVFWQGPAWLKKQWDSRKNQEYIILLFYNPESEEYFWYPPRQDGSAAHLDYSVSDDEDVRKFIEQGCMLAGTMHNHFGNRGSAFQSSTDSHDEAKSGATGIHWTMGYMDCKNLFEAEFHIRIVSGDFSKTILMQDCVEDPPGLELPEEWDNKLDLKPMHSQSIYSSGSHPWQVSGSWTPTRGNVHSMGHGKQSSWSSWSQKKEKRKNENVAKEDPNSLDVGGEAILSDITVLNKNCESSPIFEKFLEEYPRIANLGSGQELIRAMALCKAMYEGAQFSVFTDEFDDREEGLENVVKDLANGCVGIMASLKTFFTRQIEIQEAREQAEAENCIESES